LECFNLLRNSFIASALSQNFINAFENSPLGNHLESRFCQTAIADLIKNGGPYFDILPIILLLLTLQWFNLVILMNPYRSNDYYESLCCHWGRHKDGIFSNDSLSQYAYSAQNKSVIFTEMV